MFAVSQGVTQAFLTPNTRHAILPQVRPVGAFLARPMAAPSGVSLQAIKPIAHEPDAHYSIYDAATKKVLAANGETDTLAPQTIDAHKAFRDWVLSEAMPCIGAKNAMAKASYGLQVYEGVGADTKEVDNLTKDLLDFCQYQSRHWAKGNHFTTFVAVFPKAKDGALTAAELERLANRVSTTLYRTTRQSGRPFRSFLAICLHPESEAPARRFAHPAIVFNADAQFTHLNDINKRDPITKAIQAREKQLYGPRTGKPKFVATTIWFNSINEALKRFYKKV